MRMWPGWAPWTTQTRREPVKRCRGRCASAVRSRRGLASSSTSRGHQRSRRTIRRTSPPSGTSRSPSWTPRRCRHCPAVWRCRHCPEIWRCRRSWATTFTRRSARAPSPPPPGRDRRSRRASLWSISVGSLSEGGIGPRPRHSISRFRSRRSISPHPNYGRSTTRPGRWPASKPGSAWRNTSNSFRACGWSGWEADGSFVQLWGSAGRSELRDVLLDFTQQLIKTERLLEPRGSPQRRAVGDVGSIGADNDRRDLRELSIGELTGADFRAAAARESEIQEDQRDAIRACFEMRERLVSVHRFEYHVAVKFEQLRESLTDVVAVLDDENRATPWRRAELKAVDGTWRGADCRPLGHHLS